VKVYLIRSKDVKTSIYKEVYGLLIGYDGPIQFDTLNKSVNFQDESILSWDLIFKDMTTFRYQNNIQSADFLIFLTSSHNENNWLSSTRFCDGSL